MFLSTTAGKYTPEQDHIINTASLIIVPPTSGGLTIQQLQQNQNQGSDHQLSSKQIQSSTDTQRI